MTFGLQSSVLPLVVCLVLVAKLPVANASRLECHRTANTTELHDLPRWNCNLIQQPDGSWGYGAHDSAEFCEHKQPNYDGSARCTRRRGIAGHRQDSFTTYCCCGTPKCNSVEQMTKVMQSEMEKKVLNIKSECRKKDCDGHWKDKRCSIKSWAPDGRFRAFEDEGGCCFSSSDPGIKCHQRNTGAKETCLPLSFCVVEKSIKTGDIVRQGCASRLPPWWTTKEPEWVFRTAAICKVSPENTTVCFCERDHCNPLKLLEEMFVPCPNAVGSKTSAYCVKEHERCYRFVPFDSPDGQVAFSECRDKDNREELYTDPKLGQGTLLRCSTKECTERKIQPMAQTGGEATTPSGTSSLIGTQPLVILVPLIWLMIKIH